jgi:serine/threonine protein kinase, bacterial
MHWHENLTWTSWGPTSADGTGIEVLQNCTPVCASGQIWRNPVEVHFSDPEPPPADSGCPSDTRFYTQLIVAYPTTPAPPEAALPSSAAYQGHPVYMQYNGMPAYRWNSLTPRCHPSDN